jgi:hypothetical protein
MRSLDVAVSQERAKERRGGDEERREAVLPKYERWRARLRERKIPRQSIILSNNLLGGRLLPAPPRCRLGCARWTGYMLDDRGGHQSER